LLRDIEPLLTRPVGRPSNVPVIWYSGFPVTTLWTIECGCKWLQNTPNAAEKPTRTGQKGLQIRAAGK
jgi:hypothetical protein